MEKGYKTLNYSVGNKPPVDNNILSYEESQLIMLVNYNVICTLIGLFGIVTNVINMVVFYKQGLNTSINITFFALAISDLGGLTMQQWFNLWVNPLFEKADLPMVPSEFQYMIAATPRVIFSRITCLITVYITMERCLCIIFPLHVKQMITPRRTTIVMTLIYISTFLSFAPFYCASSIGWKFYPDRNRTLLGLIYNAHSVKLTECMYLNLSLIALASFSAVVIFTGILIRKLGQKSAWRRTVNADQGKSETMSKRDRKTISMIVLIASILIICYIPDVIILLVTLFESEFSIIGRYKHLFLAIWSFGFVFETLNSSVNIFLYLKMSAKYKESFHAIFAACSCNKIVRN